MDNSNDLNKEIPLLLVLLFVTIFLHCISSKTQANPDLSATLSFCILVSERTCIMFPIISIGEQINENDVAVFFVIAFALGFHVLLAYQVLMI